MKKILLLACVTMMTLYGKAQENQPLLYTGMQMINGEIGYSTTSNKSSGSVTNTGSKMIVMPMYGYMVNNHWSIGTGIGYKSEHIKNTNQAFDPDFGFYNLDDQTSTDFLISPYFAFYHKLSDKFYYSFSCNLDFDFGNSKVEFSNVNVYNGNVSYDKETVKEKIMEYGISINPGLTYFLNKHWAADLNLGMLQFISSTVKPTGSAFATNVTTNYFIFDYNLIHANFGVSYYFGCGEKK